MEIKKATFITSDEESNKFENENIKNIMEVIYNMDMNDRIELIKKLYKELEDNKIDLYKIELFTIAYWEVMEPKLIDEISREKNIKYLNLAKEYNSKNPFIYYILWKINYNEKKYQLAIQNYKKAIEYGIIKKYSEVYENTIYTVYFEFAFFFLELNDLNRAEKYLQKYISVAQTDYQGYIIMSEFYLNKIKNLDLASKYIERAYVLANNGMVKKEVFGKIYNIRGEIHEKEGEM